MAEHPLRTIEIIDPKLFSLIQETHDLALGDGVLPRKFKILIALALDAAHGATDGVRSLAQVATQAGATKDEIAEVLRVTNYICGVGSIYTSSRAIKDLF